MVGSGAGVSASFRFRQQYGATPELVIAVYPEGTPPGTVIGVSDGSI
jgi:hypothetical protein